jgi:DNA polymerase (family 10)
VLRGGGSLSVHLTDSGHYGAALLFAAGSQVEMLEALACERGMTLTGLERGRKIVAAKSETGIYAALGLPFNPTPILPANSKAACPPIGFSIA